MQSRKRVLLFNISMFQTTVVIRKKRLTPSGSPKTNKVMIIRRKTPRLSRIPYGPTHAFVSHLDETKRHLFRRKFDRGICINGLGQLGEFSCYNFSV